MNIDEQRKCHVYHKLFNMTDETCKRTLIEYRNTFCQRRLGLFYLDRVMQNVYESRIAMPKDFDKHFEDTFNRTFQGHRLTSRFGVKMFIDDDVDSLLLELYKNDEPCPRDISCAIIDSVRYNAIKCFKQLYILTENKFLNFMETMVICMGNVEMFHIIEDDITYTYDQFREALQSAHWEMAEYLINKVPYYVDSYTVKCYMCGQP